MGTVTRLPFLYGLGDLLQVITRLTRDFFSNPVNFLNDWVDP